MSCFVGIQIGPNTIYDEGIEYCLDLLQKTASVNALFVYTHQTMTPGCRDVSELADHGKPFDPARLNQSYTWTVPHEEYYQGTFLRHLPRDAGKEYGEKDILADLLEPCRQRGMKLFSRILGGWDLSRPNFPQVWSVDHFGRTIRRPCFHHPAYRAFYVSLVEDMFRSYPIDGLKYGHEKGGPLSATIMGGEAGFCFCEHCKQRGRSEGVDPARAIEGYRALHELCGALDTAPPPTDGIFISILRLLWRYPEILAWDRLWHEGKSAIPKHLYGVIKAIRPEATFGTHVAHGPTTLDLFERAATDYAAMVPYHDWIKPVVYHDCAGPRLSGKVARWARLLQGEPQLAAEFLYAVQGYDKTVEPAAADLPNTPLSAEHVYREVKRAVDAVDGAVPIYSGVGFNMPGGSFGPEGGPKTVYDACIKSFQAGAAGLLLSREYDEMTLENLRAVGKALSDLGKV